MAQTTTDDRLSAAEEAVWNLLLAIHLGLLDDMPVTERPLLADPLLRWCALAVRDGLLRSSEEDAGKPEEPEREDRP